MPTGAVSLQRTDELRDGCADKRYLCRQEMRTCSLLLNWESGCADRRWLCRQKTEVLTGDESLRDLKARCADRRWMSRQDMRVFSVHMSCMLGVPTGEGCRQETEVSTGDVGVSTGGVDRIVD